MINRKSLSPILSAVAFSFVLTSPAPADLKAPEQSGSASSSNASYVPPAAPSVSIISSNPAATITTPAAQAPTAPATLPPRTAQYTVVKGDSLTKIAEKFNTTRKKLQELNQLAEGKVTAGQVILVPSSKKTKALAAATTAKAPVPTGLKAALKPSHVYLRAQPVQDFDIPASTFGSCPVPMPSDGDTPVPAPTKAAPVAQLVSPSELAADMAKMEAENAALAAAKKKTTAKTLVVKTTPAPVSQPTVAQTPVTQAPSGLKSDNGTKRTFANGVPVPSPQATNSPLVPHQSSSRSMNRTTIAQGQSQKPADLTPTNDWGVKFTQQARSLGDKGIEYCENWRPPGEARSWSMDCSNTSRYLYQVTTGIQLPRTASDQYYYLHLQGKAWDVPQTAQGWADGNYLRQNLKPGDLLFWENTYRPERQPPITHVMVFLGTNAQGQWLMAGSQGSRGGEHNRRNGGPDIYVFRPSQPCGGYSTWLGAVRHTGRFCAFGRPLEADRTKLSVAANN